MCPIDTAEKAVKTGDAATFLDCVNKSGLSSLTLLQNCHVPADEAQPVVLGIETSRRIIKDGAVRVHGGGFAGTVQAFVPLDMLDEFKTKIENVLGENMCHVLSIRPVGGYELK